MAGDLPPCNLDPPDPAKQVDTSKPLIHDCIPAPGSPEATAAAPPDNRPLTERVLDWAFSLLPESQAEQVHERQFEAELKAEHTKFTVTMDLESRAQRVMQDEAFTAFKAHPELFPNDNSRMDAYFALMQGYKLRNVPEPSTPLNEQQQKFVDDFGWNHSKGTPNDFRTQNPYFPFVYMNRHY